MVTLVALSSTSAEGNSPHSENLEVRSMELSRTIFIVAVCFASWEVANANPYVTEWWRKGVATVKNFIVGHGPGLSYSAATWPIEFDPEAGPEKALDYQRHFGYRGERLVEFLGSGNDRSQRIESQFSQHRPSCGKISDNPEMNE